MDGIHSPNYTPWSPTSCGTTVSLSTNTPVSSFSDTPSSPQNNTPVSSSVSPLLLCPDVEFVLDISDDDITEDASGHWRSVGSIQPASAIHIIAFSSDGELFATAGEVHGTLYSLFFSIVAVKYIIYHFEIYLCHINDDLLRDIDDILLMY